VSFRLVVVGLQANTSGKPSAITDSVVRGCNFEVSIEPDRARPVAPSAVFTCHDLSVSRMDGADVFFGNH
jgi:hypothetical protein